MTTRNFPLPAVHGDRFAQRGEALSAARRGGPRRVMNAEEAARIALRRLGAEAAARDGETDQPMACSGWFDSTWELSQGLDICEVQADELPLDGWLQLYLAHDPAAAAVNAAAAMPA